MPRRFQFTTGDKELDKILETLGRRYKSITRRAIKAGLKVLGKAIKQDAPKGKTKALKKSIGERFKRTRKDEVEAKVGINVAKKPANEKGETKSGSQAPHGPMNVLGTKLRFTKRGKSTGQMNPNGFVRRAVNRAKSQALAKIRANLTASLEKVAAKQK